jgi:hypothetical protein
MSTTQEAPKIGPFWVWRNQGSVNLRLFEDRYTIKTFTGPRAEDEAAEWVLRFGRYADRARWAVEARKHNSIAEAMEVEINT